MRWYPQSKDENGGKSGRRNHGVEPTPAVRYNAGEDSAKDAVQRCEN